MKILLISANECVEPYQVYPLGMSVAARAFQEAGCEVSQADIMLHKLDGIRKLLTENDFELCYTEDEGKHDWDYWDRHIKLALDWLPLDEKVGGLNSGNIKGE